MTALAAFAPTLAPDALRAISQAATSSLAAAIWQGILLALAAALGLRLLPKVPASARFAIWFTVFLAVAALPAISLLPHRASVAAAHPVPTHPLLTLDTHWCLAILALWAFASLFRAATLIVAALRLRSLWKRATPLDLAIPSDISGSGINKNCHPERSAQRAVEGPAANRVPHPSRLHRDGWDVSRPDPRTPRAAQLCVSDHVDRPSVIGFFAPKILIPRWLIDRLTPAELHQIVLHEGTHLRRADDWLNLLQKLALVLFPLNPALLWVERRLCTERELACDEQVLRATGAPRAYAACLASLAEHRMGRRSLALALGALGRTAERQAGPRSELGRRVHSILSFGDRMSAARARLVTGVAAAALLVGAGELSRCPQFVAFSGAPNPTQASAPTPPTHFSSTRTSPYVAENVVFHTAPVAESRRITIDPGGPSFAALSQRVGYRRQTASSAKPVDIDINVPSSQHPTRPIHGWLVVTTSWVASDGSRLVLTTAHASDVYPTAVEPDADNADQLAPPNPQPQVHPYAAVPVRGGWLLFQL